MAHLLSFDKPGKAGRRSGKTENIRTFLYDPSTARLMAHGLLSPEQRDPRLCKLRRTSTAGFALSLWFRNRIPHQAVAPGIWRIAGNYKV